MAIIAISGYPGAGKSTLAEKLATALGYENINIGAIFKKLAERDNCDITQFYKNLKHDPDMEIAIDHEQAELMREKDNRIIQGRMAPFFQSPFKKINILLKVEDEEGSRRQMNRPENQRKTFKEVLQLSKERLIEEKKRYLYLYKLKDHLIKDHLDERIFDIVLNTTYLNEDITFKKIYLDIKMII